MRRRSFLAACVAAGVAGCLGDGGETESDPGAAATTDRPTSTPAESTATATPTGTPTPAPTETLTDTATATASATQTATGTPVFPGYETTEVRVTTTDGEVLGSVTAAIADTGALRSTGLSETEHLPEDRGMLFVYDEVDERDFHMPNMDFGIDIVYADGDGVITRIHHAPEPGPDEDGSEQIYPGRGQYVFEVNKGWTTDRGIEEGDVLEFEL